MRLELDVFGDVQLAREILRFERVADNLEPAFRDLTDDFRTIEARQFSTQGGYRSGGWAPLAASTLAAKVRRGLDPRILHATHKMRDSFTQRDHPDHVEEIDADGFFVGSRAVSDRGFPYPAAHQRPLRGQARRRPVELNEQDRRRWVKRIQREFVEGRRGL